MLNAILHKGKLVGLFSDYQKCKVMFEGLISNNFADRKNLEIKSYYENKVLKKILFQYINIYKKD
jgi:hypothetical protein